MNEIIILTAKYLYLVSIVMAGVYFFQAKSEEKKRLGLLAIVTLPLALILGKLSSHFISDPRPFVVLHVTPLIAHAADNGFPSDHTLLTMTIAAIIFVFNKKWGVVLGIIALLVGVSRILALVHHPLDIAGSTIIAIAAAFVGVFIQKAWEKRKISA
jgi:undecaprenyl-diphosphatase